MKRILWIVFSIAIAIGLVTVALQNNTIGARGTSASTYQSPSSGGDASRYKNLGRLY